MPLEIKPSRRHLLGMAAGVAGLGLHATTAMAAQEKTMAARHGLIDVHHHILPPGAPPPMKTLFAGWTPQSDLAAMDAAGVSTAIVLPGLMVGPDPDQNRKLSRAWNEYGAGLGRDHPGRFGLFAALPMKDVEGSLAEIDYAYDQLHVDGCGVATNYGDLWLGDAAFQPIWDKLNSRRAVVFVHPTDAPCCAPAKMTYTRPNIDGSWIEWPMNTARTIFSLTASGTTRRYPDIRFIFCHGGGVMPLLVERVAGLAAWPRVGAQTLETYFPDGIAAEFAKLHFECAQACSHTNMGALRSLVPDTQILFGSDSPIFPQSYGSSQFAKLNLPPAVAHAIGRGNAGALMPRWA